MHTTYYIYFVCRFNESSKPYLPLETFQIIEWNVLEQGVIYWNIKCPQLTRIPSRWMNITMVSRQCKEEAITHRTLKITNHYTVPVFICFTYAQPSQPMIILWGLLMFYTAHLKSNGWKVNVPSQCRNYTAWSMWSRTTFVDIGFWVLPLVWRDSHLVSKK